MHISKAADLRRTVLDTKGFIFDLDGTLYLGDRLVDGAAASLQALRDADKRVAFVSNKPIGSRDEYASKLNRLGISCSTDEVLNSSLVVARYLQRKRPGCVCFPVAEKPVFDDLADHGLQISEDPEEIEVVVISFDRTFDYRKLNIAYRASLHGADLIATNPDRTCPMPGYNLPDAACMIAAIEACTERTVQPIVGKPSSIMLEEAMAICRLQPEECMMLGDRPETDITMARNAGMTSTLVLTGVVTADKLDGLPIEPDYVIQSVATLKDALSA